MTACFKNAQSVAHIAVFDRAFHYGDGCFTTARIENNAIHLYERHLTRLQQGCQNLQLQVDFALLEQTLIQLKQQYVSLNGTLKIVVSRGEGQRGYSLPKQSADLWVFYYPQQLTPFEAKTYSVGVLQQRLGLNTAALVGIKTLNRLEQVLFKAEADQKAWIEALVIDLNGQIIEGISSNCFLLMNNQWISPELRYNGVHGVMRAEILQRMQTHNIPCAIRPVAEAELSLIQSLFFCNALDPMKIVTQLDQYDLNTQPCIDLFYRLKLNQMHTYVKK